MEGVLHINTAMYRNYLLLPAHIKIQIMIIQHHQHCKELIAYVWIDEGIHEIGLKNNEGKTL